MSASEGKEDIQIIKFATGRFWRKAITRVVNATEKWKKAIAK